MKKFFPYLFLSIAILQLIGLYYDSSLRIITKPFIMISLAAFYFAYAKDFKITFFTALVAALLGDIFLMWEGELFFMLGLFSFLVMQVLYSLEFFSQKDSIDVLDKVGAGTMVLIAAAMIYYLVPKVDGVLIGAIPIYSLCIMVMVVTAVWRNRAHWSYIPVLCGALLFFISDSLIAMDRFATPFEHSYFIIMTTYMAAQFFIVMGIADAVK